MSRTKIVVLYSLFSAISIAANIGTQKIYLMFAPLLFAVLLSVLAGTTVGLGVKFLLDKVWIFEYQHRDIAHGIQSFILYSTMGLATTAIFWGFEFSADHLFGTETARLTGGTIGLVIGYLVKYRLDKKFVFA
ncbi:GtrA family protein [Paraburkholderia sp. A1BS-2L]|uniref:GtrA family protein n=1 Tax=Paraburkholderia sp. A1BS-2L TaxID=3028373 RepID=UPI003DA91A4B